MTDQADDLVNARKAAKILSAHFGKVSRSDFESGIRQFCPNLADGNFSTGNSAMTEGQQLSLLTLPTPHSTSMHLDAYLASALTGLDRAQRDLIFQLSDSISEICSKYDIELYEPRKNTDPVHHKDVPDVDVFQKDREKVLRSDLLIHLTHFPSTGSGEELDFAYNALLPILIISRSEDHVSRMITGIPSLSIQIEYREPEELRQQLEDCLTRIRPILQERKVAFAEYEKNIVGDRVRTLRKELRMTREDVSKVVPELTVGALRQLEDNVDRVSNPSLIQLRQLATVLKTTVADLAEPDMTANLLAYLQNWMEGKEAARYSGISKADRNRIIRRILLRVIDSLEKED